MNAELLALFVSSATDRLARMLEALPRIENEADRDEVMKQLKRDLHTLKGESTVLDLPQITEIVHAAEDCLKRGGEGPGTLEDVLGEALELIRECVLGVGEGPKPSEDRVRAVVARLLETTSSMSKPTSAATTSASSGAGAKAADAGSRRGLLSEKERPEGEKERSEGPSLALGSQEIATSEGAAGRPQTGLPLSESADAESSISVVRLRSTDLAEMTELVNQLAGGLVRSANHLQALRSLEASTTDRATARALSNIVREMREDAFWMERSNTVLANHIKDVRLRPLQTILIQYPTFVRRAARGMGKEVDFEMDGCDVRMDQHVLEQIAEPMLHLVRNAIVHGVEPPEERRRLGKPSKGTLRVTARPDAGFVEIAVEDDGAGIDVDRVGRRAVAIGMVDEDRVSKLSWVERAALIFSPGLSTLTDAGSLGGRGVGLDVVKSVVDRMGGHVHVESEAGVGTRFVLRVPISQSLSRALIVETNGLLFAFPNVSVAAAMWLPMTDVRAVNGALAMEFRGRLISIVHLGSLLRVGTSTDVQRKKLGVVVVASGEDFAAFVVERFLGEREIVIRPMGTFLGRPELLGGVVVLESGDMALVLHAPSILRAARANGAPSGKWAALKRWIATGEEAMPAESGANEPASHQRLREARPGVGRRVLYAEDSVATRKFSADIMRSRGYEVVEASDGAEALALLEREPFDLVLTDLQMPVLDGFSVIQQVRRDPGLRRLPVIVLSTLSAEEARLRAIESGATAFFVKSPSGLEALMATMRDVLGGA